MARHSQFADTPLPWHDTQEYLPPDFVGRLSAERHKGKLQRWVHLGRVALAPKALVPLAAFATITAVMLFVYICSLSIRRRIPSWSFGRRLAEEGDDSEWCNVETTSGESSYSPTFLAEGFEGSVHGEYLRSEAGNGVFAPSTGKAITPYEGKITVGATTQRRAEGTSASAKRKLGGLDTGTAAKHSKPSFEDLPPLSQSPLDPLLDSLIDSVLSQGEEVLAESFLLYEERMENEFVGAFPTSDSEEAAGDADFWTLPADASTLEIAAEPSSSAAVPKRHAVSDTRDSGDARSFSFLQSVLSESSAALSPGHWVIGDEEPPWEAPVGAGFTPPQLKLSTVPDERGDATEASQQTSPGDPSTSGTSYYGPVVSITQASTSELNNTPTVQTPAHTDDGGQGLRRRSSEPAVGGMPPTVTLATVRPVPPEVKAHALPREGKRNEQEQPASMPPPLTVLGSFTAPNWLHSMYRGVPDRVLQSHPFYFHPREQSDLNMTTFRPSVARTFRLMRKFPLHTLDQCRGLMKKKQLTSWELKELLFATERLVGFATGCMPQSVSTYSIIPAVNALGSIFFVLDTLHCAAEVLGENSMRSVWWPEVVRQIEHVGYQHRTHLSKNSAVAEMADLTLNYYRRGLRPPTRLVICLKEVLLEKPSTFKFSSPSWDAWRRDSEEWRRGTLPAANSQ